MIGRVKRWAWLAAALVGGLAPAGAAAQEASAGTAPVEIVVFGTEHLWQIDRAANPVGIEPIRAALARFQPDLVVVEWLHPSVDRARAFNYAPLGDMATLRRLWGYPDAVAMPERIAALRGQIGQAKAAGLPLASARLELGKALYLSGDQLNAAYQWWLAARAGADVADLRRLTRNNLAGHEIEVWGFEIAAAQGQEYLTPFDYQGDDIGSEVWGELLEQLRTLALRQRDGLGPDSPGYAEAARAFDLGRERFEAGTSQAWAERYGSIREVGEYVAAWRGFAVFGQRRPAPDPAGLASTRWLQSDEYLAIERRTNDEGVASISIGGLGRRRVDGNVRRNRHMAEFARADIARLGARRVLVIVGSTHKYFLEPIFREMGFRVVPSARYVP